MYTLYAHVKRRDLLPVFLLVILVDDALGEIASDLAVPPVDTLVLAEKALFREVFEVSTDADGMQRSTRPASVCQGVTGWTNHLLQLRLYLAS